MFKHILVPVDGSSNAEKAVDTAIAQAKAFGAQITLVTVIDNYPFTGVGGDFAYGQVEYLAAATANANSALEKSQATIHAQGMSCEKRVIEEHVIHEGILDTAKELGVDLISSGGTAKAIAGAGVPVTDVDVPEHGEHVHAAQMDSLLLTQGAFAVLSLIVGAFLVVNLMAAMLARAVAPIAPTGTQWNTASAPRTASSMLAAGRPKPISPARFSASAFPSNSTTSPAAPVSRAARAIDPPISPTPMMAIWLKTGAIDYLPRKSLRCFSAALLPSTVPTDTRRWFGIR